MKTWKKLLSLFLAVLMLCGTLTGLVVTVSADETTAATDGTADDATTEDTTNTVDYLNQVFANPEEKLATMKLKLEKGNFRLYCDEYSGEVAVYNTKTGQILSTNPYDVGVGSSSGTAVSEDMKKDLLSQIIIEYESNGKPDTYDSYTYAAERDQITVKNIRNGIRVEYIIGREEARHLVPRMITDQSFRTKILGPIIENMGLRPYMVELGLLQEDQDPSELDLASVPADVFNGNSQAFPFAFKQLINWYYGQNGKKSIANQKTDSLKQALIAKYPVLKKQPDMEFWVLDSGITSVNLEKQEQTIKTYAPDYSYEDLDADHQETEYESSETNPPVFKMALEYTLDVGDDGTIDGLTVRMPVNGLSFNESLYQLTSISILPYMGCGNNTYDGYVFFPDGSGTLFAMEDLRDNTSEQNAASKVYGEDYAYYKLKDYTYQQTVRYPVYGIVEESVYYNCSWSDTATGNDESRCISGVIYDKIKNAEAAGTTLTDSELKKIQDILKKDDLTIEKVVKKNGFAAIIEEGDALATMKYHHGGSKYNYDTLMLSFEPRPKDSYNLADSISVGTNSEWTVVTDRKYTGNFKLHYVMLSDQIEESEEEEGSAALTELAAQEDSIALATGVNSDGSYAPSWMGMAYVYRDYLEKKGLLSKLTSEETSGDIPLYIETFGSLYTTEKFASIPVSVKRALTSAADVITMYEELQEADIKNVNFKLTGYANGGMYSKVPYNLKWEKSVSKGEDENGDKVTMSDLFDYAADSDGLELFPDFDFAYVSETGWFDGLSLRKHVVRTIDDRYVSKKEYEPTTQKFVSYYQLAISPAYFSHFYEKFLGKYLEYNVSGISVATLGNALNSDFDEDEPYNREDSRTFVKKALEYISSQDLDIMVEGGNAYTWKYIQHILDAPLDSSQFLVSSYSVPFLGVVLHSYLNYAGSPLNMEGNVNYAKLKAIESGASPYFILAYDNTDILKDYYTWSHYYSVRYDIWKDDVVELYNELNEALKDVQDKTIVKHEFLSGLRVPDLDELEGDMDDLFDAAMDYQQNQAEYEQALRSQEVSDARKIVTTTEERVNEYLKNCLSNYGNGMSGAAYALAHTDRVSEKLLADYMEADAAYKQAQAEYDAALENGADAAELEACKAVIEGAKDSRDSAFKKLRPQIKNAASAIRALEEDYQKTAELLEALDAGVQLIRNTPGIYQSIVNDVEERQAAILEKMELEQGIEFKNAADKIVMDTFLSTHIALLMASTNGTSYGKQAGIVGKAENLYDLLCSGEFGLMKGNDVEYTLLRYLEENKTLTDAQLDEKYGLTDLKDGETSLSGLVKYARELFGTTYEFDPVLSDEKGEEDFSEVDKHILSYYYYKLYKRAGSIASTSLSILPTLENNFTISSKLIEVTDSEGNVMTCKPTKDNRDEVISSIKGSMKEALDNYVGSITDGNYKNGLDAVIKEQVKEAKKTIESRAPGKSDKPVVYTTPETLEEDLRVFLEAYCYVLMVQTYAPRKSTVSALSIVTTTYTTDTSINTLVADRMAAMTAADVTTDDYAAVVAWLQSDSTTVDRKLDRIMAGMKWLDPNDIATKATVKAELQKAYLKGIVAALKITELPSDAKLPFKSDKNPKNTTLSNDLIERFEEASVLGLDLASYVTEIKALLDTEGYELTAKKDGEDSYNYEALATQFVNASYLVALSQQTAQTYYVDEKMGTMDKEVRDAVADMHETIVSALPADATAFDVYDAILKALGNTEDSVAQLTGEIADKVDYYISDTKQSMAADVQNYYIYLLFQSFSEELAMEAPLLTVYVEDKNGDQAPLTDEDTKYQNIIGKNVIGKLVDDKIDELIAQAKDRAARGELADYSLTLTDEEMDAWVESVYQKIEDGRYLTASENQKPENVALLKSDIKAYLQYQYYTQLTDFNGKLSVANSWMGFHVAEVYGRNLYEAATGTTTAGEQTGENSLKGLVYYFIPELCGDDADKEYLDGLFSSGSTIDDVDDEEDSKYITNDGRIVAVTYGSKNGSSYTNDKTFLLNYNNFSVSVRYDDVTYTIPAYGYVVVTH